MKRKVLSECLSIAIKHNTPDHPEWDCYHHFSFLIQRNKIVTFGMNRRSSPLTHLGFESHTKMHSEIDVCYKAKGIMDKSQDFEVVNVRLTKGNRIKESSPCKCCYAFLKHLGCKRIWFTTRMGGFAVILP